MRTKPVVLILGMLFFIVPSMAFGDSGIQDRGYVGGQIVFGTYDENNVPDADLTAILVRPGYHVNKYFSIEGRFGLGIGDDTVTVYGYDVNVELDYLIGAYGRGHIPITETFSIYGILGVTNAELTATANGFSYSESDTGLSFGFGLDFYINEQFGINAEYMKYLDESEYEVDAFGGGVIFLF